MKFETLFCFGKEKAQSPSGDMRYDRYLPQGWPVGTNVGKGTYNHLFKDHVGQFGMRWTQPGARAILDLRAVRVTNDWDEDQRFSRQPQHQRLCGACPTAPPGAQPFPLSQVAQVV